MVILIHFNTFFRECYRLSCLIPSTNPKQLPDKQQNDPLEHLQSDVYTTFSSDNPSYPDSDSGI